MWDIILIVIVMLIVLVLFIIFLSLSIFAFLYWKGTAVPYISYFWGFLLTAFVGVISGVILIYGIQAFRWRHVIPMKNNAITIAILTSFSAIMFTSFIGAQIAGPTWSLIDGGNKYLEIPSYFVPGMGVGSLISQLLKKKI